MYIFTDYINYDNINIIFEHSVIILSIIYRDLIMSLSFLKLIALISMTIDHITRILPAQTILMNLFGMGRPESAALLRAVQPLGRVAYPLFAFCVAQGCLHTSNKKRYLLRLLFCAILSEIPFQLAFYAGNFHPAVNNVIFTMLIGALACMSYSYFCRKNKKTVAYILAICFAVLAEILGTDYGAFGVIIILIPYIVESKKYKLLLLFIALTIFYMGYASLGDPSYIFLWLNPNNNSFLNLYTLNWLASLLSLVCIGLYNNSRGIRLKWLFYLYYPLHLLLLFFLRRSIYPS